MKTKRSLDWGFSSTSASRRCASASSTSASSTRPERNSANRLALDEAADRVLAGESVWSICTRLEHERAFRTVAGRAWTVQTLTSILTSPRIAGFRTHRGKVVGEGRWKRIIDQDRHDALVAALTPRKSNPRKGRTYPLVGFLVCGKCGGPLRSLTRENSGRSHACKKGPGMGGCGGIRIQTNGLRRHVAEPSTPMRLRDAAA